MSGGNQGIGLVLVEENFLKAPIRSLSLFRYSIEKFFGQIFVLRKRNMTFEKE